MVWSYQCAGSLCYPFLGKGLRAYTRTIYPHKGAFLAPAVLLKKASEVVLTPKMLVLLIGIAGATAVALVRPVSAARRAALLAGLGAGIFSIGLMTVVFSHTDLWRYSYPFAVFASLLAYRTILRLTPQWAMELLRKMVCLLLGFQTLFYGVEAVLASCDLPQAITQTVTNRAGFPTVKTNQYRRLQAAVPQRPNLLHA